MAVDCDLSFCALQAVPANRSAVISTDSNISTAAPSAIGSDSAGIQLRLLRRFAAEAPFQPATNLWRAVELPVLASVLPKHGYGLDIGCGDGVLTAILKGLAGGEWKLVGLDPDPAETALATRSGIYEQVHTAKADSIPEFEATFDFAFANSVLEHVPNLSDCVREISRVLKPGGLFAATVPAPSFHQCLKGPGWTRWVSRQEYLREIDQRLAHVQYWDLARWDHELLQAGLESLPAIRYLSKNQVQRWELWSNWTGGLLYRLGRGKSQPISIQRKLGLRQGLPRPLHFLIPLMGRIVAMGIGPDREDSPEETGCFLITARKSNAAAGQ